MEGSPIFFQCHDLIVMVLKHQRMKLEAKDQHILLSFLPHSNSQLEKIQRSTTAFVVSLTSPSYIVPCCNTPDYIVWGMVLHLWMGRLAP